MGLVVSGYTVLIDGLRCRSRLRSCVEHCEEDSPDGDCASSDGGAVEALWLV